MKIKLLFIFYISTLLLQAQAPISNYFSTPNSQFEIVSGTIDQAPTGANATWNFTDLTSSGTNTDTFVAPTAAQLTSYPGSTQVFIITDGAMNTTDAFYKVAGSDLSLTGSSTPQLSLDYNTDNAFVGSYPLTFGSAPTVDNIAGQIIAQGQSPNYSGTITTEVDAYGTLNYDVTGQVPYTGNVTRIKSLQSLGFFVAGIFPGTANITTYNYYDDASGALVFRTTEGAVVLDIVNINESFSSVEGLTRNSLSLDNNQLLTNTISVFPNPAQHVLNIELSNTQLMISVQIMDMNGRMVLSNKGTRSVVVSALRAGLYIVVVETEKGTITKKFIKT